MLPHDTSAIVADGLEKRYPGDVTALDGLSFSVEAGTIFGLLGPNGAGKSTTVKVLTTLSRPDAGAAIGRRVRRPRRAGARAARDRHGRPADRRRPGGHRAREPRARRTGPRPWGPPRCASACAELLERFGLADAADRIARTYSGGMQRKLDVAMGLIHRPRVLFLDEPTTGLDPEARADLWAEIERLTRADELTILLTTHYLEEADRLASRLAIVDHGRVVATGSPDELKAELRGDAIVVELADGVADERAVSVLTRVPGIGESLVDGRSLRARVDRGASAVPAVLSALEGAGIGVASVTVSRPSLDDVYLRHTGRSFRHTEESYA